MANPATDNPPAKVYEHRCIDKLSPDVRRLICYVQRDDELERLRELVLVQRDRAIIGCMVEIGVSTIGMMLYDIQRSFLIPVLNAFLVGLSAVGLKGALALQLKKIQIHGIITTGLIIATVLNFICEALLSESGLGSETLPQWIVLTLLLVPYTLNLVCSVLSLVLATTLTDLLDREDECSGLLTCEELEQQATELTGQNVCCVCMTNGKDAVVTPCGHKAMCLSCAQQVCARGRPCPVCRGRINEVFRVFDS